MKSHRLNPRIILVVISLVLAISLIIPLSAQAAVDDSYTKSLLHFNGDDGSIIFTDESGKAWTRAGGAAQIDTDYSVFGSASGKFNGYSDYIESGDSSDWSFGTGDFTIDCWVRLSNLSTNRIIFYHRTDGYHQWQFWIWNSKLSFSDSDSGLDVHASASGLSINTWHHIAVVRSGTSWYFFVDGSQTGTTQTSDKAVTDFTGNVAIGRPSTTAQNFSGWIDEIRVSKGIARWISNFDPLSYEYGTTPTETPTSTANYTATNTMTETMTATASETSTETITPTFTETPTVTFTPTETVSPTFTSTPTITETPTITLTPTTPPPIIWAEGPVTLSEALLAALASTLQADPPADAESNIYAVTNISGVDTAWNVSVVNLVDVAPPYDVWNQEDNAVWAWFMECAGSEPTWTCNYYELPAGGGTGSLRFPWRTGYSAYYGVAGVHAGAVTITGSLAVDFVGGDSMGSEIMPPQVVAVADGTITNVCNDGVSIAIRVDGGPTTVAYFHFATGQSFSEGQTITQGQVLGQLKYGPFIGLICGYAIQNADQYHLHFVFVPTSPGYLEIGGCVLDLDTEAFVCNGKTYSPTSLIPNGGGTSIPGTPVPGSPPDYPTGGGAHIWDGIVAAIVSLNTDTLSQFLPDQNPIIGYMIQKLNLFIQALLGIFMTIYYYGLTGTLLIEVITAVIAMELAIKVVELAIYLLKEFGWLLKFMP